jgi:hypothetical protein
VKDNALEDLNKAKLQVEQLEAQMTALTTVKPSKRAIAHIVLEQSV